VTLGRVAEVAATLSGSVVTLFYYVALFVVQTVNADSACETYPTSVQGVNSSDVRGITFRNSWLNFGGSCTYRLQDGSVVSTRAPELWFSGTNAGVISVFAGLVVYLARRKGHQGFLFGLCTLAASPFGLSIMAVAPRRADGVDAVFQGTRGL
jgi:hypothetical protein